MEILILNVTRHTRLFIGIIMFGVSFPFLLFPELRQIIPQYQMLVPIILGIMLITFIYLFAFGKLILRHSNDRLDFEWKKRLLFDSSEIESVNKQEIRSLVVDNGMFLKKIITNNKVLEINNIKPITKDAEIFIQNLIKTVESNNGRVINSEQYSQEKGYKDFSFYIFVASIALSIFLISRLWQLIEYNTLLLLFIPVIAYIGHVKRRIDKKNFARLNQGCQINELEIQNLLNEINILENNLTNNFYDKLLDANISGMIEYKRSFYNKFYKDLKLNIKILSKFFEEMIKSDMNDNSILKFINCLMEKTSSERVVFLVNIKLALYWHQIISKLHEEILTTQDQEKINQSENLLGIIDNITKELLEVKN